MVIHNEKESLGLSDDQTAPHSRHELWWHCRGAEAMSDDLMEHLSQSIIQSINTDDALLVSLAATCNEGSFCDTNFSISHH